MTGKQLNELAGKVNRYEAEMKAEEDRKKAEADRLAQLEAAEAERQYDAVPRTPFRNTPIENASNVEIPLGAIAVDSIYAQMIDLIYTISQPITIRHKHKDFVQRAKAMQAWADLLVHEINLRSASEHSIFDTAQLGTGFYYTPFVSPTSKTKPTKSSAAVPKSSRCSLTTC